eukprot:scaffold215918_cov20-Tisochrysis_lutea.AAC.1
MHAQLLESVHNEAWQEGQCINVTVSGVVVGYAILMRQQNGFHTARAAYMSVHHGQQAREGHEEHAGFHFTGPLSVPNRLGMHAYYKEHCSRAGTEDTYM